MLPTNSTGAELGVWKGAFSAQLLERVRPERLHLVDPWTFRAELPQAFYGGAVAGPQQDMDAIYESVRARFAKAISEGTVQIHRAQSDVAAATFGIGELDWVYIDGDHRYEAVREELDLYSRLVKPGGIVAGDDYHGRGWWKGGVKRAVDEWASKTAIDELTFVGSQFVARLPA